MTAAVAPPTLLPPERDNIINIRREMEMDNQKQKIILVISVLLAVVLVSVQAFNSGYMVGRDLAGTENHNRQGD